MKKYQSFRKLSLESLEDRQLLAVTAGGFETAVAPAAPTEGVFWVVNTTDDPLSWSTSDSVLSLREAISRANDGDSITFGSSLSGKTITLNGNKLLISNKSVSIDASSIGGITVDANGNSRVFHIDLTMSQTVSLSNLTICGGGAVETGGGIYRYSGNLILTHCTIVDNAASGSGAGIDSHQGTLTMRYCTVSSNRITDSYGKGGGMYTMSETIMLGCTVTNNTAFRGGGIFNDGKSLTMAGCSVSGNTAENSGYGGGIENDGTLGMTNCLVSDNYAGQGGGIYNSNILTATNCTIAGNDAYIMADDYPNGEGGGIYNKGTSNFYNSIIARNDANGFTNPDVHDFGASNAYNCLSGYQFWDSGKNNIIYDISYDYNLPLFTDAANGDYTLVDNSEAINKGNNDYITGYNTDLVENSRIVRGTVDLGAYENQSRNEAPSTVVTTNLDIVDSTDGMISLREAIAYANPGDTITFAGTLAGKTITLNYGQLYIGMSLTIDASSIGGMTIDAHGESRIFYIDQETEDQTVELDGLTLADGCEDEGGAIFSFGNLSLLGCVLTGNCATENGGGIASYGDLTITGSVVIGNYAANEGGGIYCGDSGSLLLKISDVWQNQAAVGGGISTSALRSTILNSTVYRNSADYMGGGISSTGADMWISNCEISENACNGEETDGGGIFADCANLSITDSVISNNEATYGGGIENDDLTKAELINCLIAGNTGTKRGGGIYNAHNDHTGAELRLTNCTVTGNSSESGGGICNLETVYLYNTIVALNTTTGSGKDIHRRAGSIYAYNVLSSYSGWTGSTNFYAYSSSKPLFTDEENGDYSLAENSQAINRGNNGYLSGRQTDLAGNTRIVGGTVDLGAYEYQGTPETPSTVVTTNLDIVDPTDGLISLREAIDYANPGDTVTFAAGLSGKTITLNWAELSVAKSISINASSIGGVIIDAAYGSRVFSVTGGSLNSPVNMVGLVISRGSDVYGAGIDNSGVLTMTDCTVTGCQAAGEGSGNSAGGGIFNDNILTMINCSVTNNSVRKGYEPWGGGIANANGTLTMIQCSVTDNFSSNEGGGIFNDAELVMENCIVADNIAGDNGGGIDNFGSLVMTNCAVTGNISRSVNGGIYTCAEMTMANCTVAGNSAEGGEGGGLGHDGISSIYNSIIVQNMSGGSSNDVYTGGSGSDIGTISAYNTLSSFAGWTESSACLTYNPSKPLFAAGSYELAANSQAINKGNNGYIAGYTTDLAGNTRVVGGTVDLGAYEYQSSAQQLAAPAITNDTITNYVSYGANRHQITWNSVANASGYQLQYSADGSRWTTFSVSETSAVVTGLTYGVDMKYRVRALGSGSYTDSNWSGVREFNVCPMDINGDGDISGGDRTILASAWLTEEGSSGYVYACDINGDGDISNGDRIFLSNNWLAEAGDSNLIYPPALAADKVFAEFASADLNVDLDVF